MGNLSAAPLLLYAGAILWTLGYDTIYAHQDKEDDALIGVKSSARKLGEKTVPFLSIVYSLCLILFVLAGVAAGLHWMFYVFLIFFALHLTQQIRSVDIDDAEACLAVFKSNRDAGALLFFAYFLGTVPLT